MSGRFGTIGVLMGGYSSEREISLRSGRAVALALAGAGHQVAPVDINVSNRRLIMTLLRDAAFDIAFIALHGRLGEDGVIQSILEEMDIPYTGCGPSASRLAFDKTITQTLFEQAGIPVPPYVCITGGDPIAFKDVFAALKNLPFVVKAACEGSSLGVYIVHHPSQWESALKDALSFGPRVIVERFIKGREFTAGIFDREVLPLIEIRTPCAFFDFTSKYQKGLTQYTVPADIDQALTQRIRQIALAAHDALGCEAFSRVDLRLDEKDGPYVLEINTIPGFTETSLFPKAASKAGYSFAGVCEKLLDLAYGKKVKH
ncbi:MAG: D-alanine--D-alanine ligase [Candidatus Omnitrophica bacterium]|nr:D-alanine--D-alanine ligase [Candidatus Omnitrophota bacterium]